jgi:hypothetical protein
MRAKLCCLFLSCFLLFALESCKRDSKPPVDAKANSSSTDNNGGKLVKKGPTQNHVFEEATFVIDKNQSKLPIGTFITPERADTLVSKYWNKKIGDNEKRFFLITLDELKELYAQSSGGDSSKVVFKASNITDTTKVSGTWMPYNKDFIEKIKNDADNQDDYYVIDKKFVFDKNPDPTPDGIALANEGEAKWGTKRKYIKANALCARISLNESGKHGVIINATFLYFIKISGLGGPPPGSGVGFPPP